MDYRVSELCEQVTTARAGYRPIVIVGGATKSFYGNPMSSVGQQQAFVLHMGGLDGVIRYEPSELVLTAWAGTRLKDIDALLLAQNQMLAFDPPRLGDASTIGGVVAAGLSGPASFGYGPLRHFVLGARLLDAQGRVLKFGGEVMKNVAGYDVSRLLAGSLGMFGALIDVSIKVLPRPAHDQTCMLELTESDALSVCRSFRAGTWPVKAAAWLPADDSLGGQADQPGLLYVRLAGAKAAVDHACAQIGGQRIDAEQADRWWAAFRDQTHPFFTQRPLWRLAVRAGTPALGLGPCAFDLAGELRWVVSAEQAPVMRASATQAGGHATLFRMDAHGEVPEQGVFHPLQPAVHTVVRRLKGEFDPKGVFNPGRLVLDL